jgi:hypothetical protein
MKTVRVRIAVAVDDNGDWGAAACVPGCDTEACSDASYDLTGTSVRYYYVEARVAVPPPLVTIKGKVTR